MKFFITEVAIPKTIIKFIEWLTSLVGVKFKKNRGSISVLLGAGFSAPMGYPIGNSLNLSILNCKGDNFAFSSAGTMCVSKDGSKPDLGYKTSYDFEFDFCRDLIEHFNKVRGYFDYEEFYDFFNFEAINDAGVKAFYDPKKYATERDLGQMLGTVKNIYVQVISLFLVDKDGNSWYDNAGHMCGPIFVGYTGILNCLKHISKTHDINVHTLNHDLFFERLNHSDWIEGNLCDGFEELGSPYYGDLDVNGRSYRCRLQRYAGKYDKPFRLFKLHGSKDYGIFYRSNEGSSRLTPDMYVKTRYGIGFGEFYKERKKGSKVYYDRCWVNYHADFLTGTTSKITRYSEPLIFKILFQHFNVNLKNAETLVIIGYGAKDAEINRMLMESFDYKNKAVYIIDPFPSVKVKELGVKLNAKLIIKQLENVTMADLS